MVDANFNHEKGDDKVPAGPDLKIEINREILKLYKAAQTTAKTGAICQLQKISSCVDGRDAAA